MPQIEGEIVSVPFHNSETKWTVLYLDPGNSQAEIKVAGIFSEPALGQSLRIKGVYEEHPKYGKSFKSSGYSVIPPRTENGVRLYLEQTLPHIGPAISEKIVEAHGLNTLEVLSNSPESLLDIAGITQQRLDKIVAAWQKNHTDREAHIFLAQYGLSAAKIKATMERFGDRVVEIIQQDPYQLVGVHGLGFLRVDKVALASGISPDAPIRRRAVILYSLQQGAEAGKGHVFLSRGQVLQSVRSLKVQNMDGSTWTLEELGQHLDFLSERGQVVLQQERVYLSSLYYAEKSTSEVLLELRDAPLDPLFPTIEDLDNFCLEYEKKMRSRTPGFQFAEEQMEVFRTANTARVLVVTGLPGTGKTTAMRALSRLYESAGKTVALAAPTGRAAKRLEDSCGRPAMTLHRLLGATSSGYWMVTEISQDVVIIDESSMVDISLMSKLMGAVTSRHIVVFVGDPAQLPSVGPGDVLRDMAGCGVLPRVHLSKIHRQSAESDIVVNSHRVHNGEPLMNRQKGDFTFVCKDSVDDVKDMLFQVSEKLAKSNLDFQILSPMRKNALGTSELNEELRKIFNPTPPDPSLTVYERTFSVRDRIIITKNNYDLGIVNGDLGNVVEIDSRERKLLVKIDGMENVVELGGEALGSVELAYSMTIHKSQGSEWGMVILLIHRSHHIMLTRNLLYTAMTRAKKRLIIIGDVSAMDKAISTNTVSSRNTYLAEYLRQGKDCS